MDYKSTAAAIIALTGGEKNIKSVMHCATRLRFSLHDSSLADKESLLGVKGVLQVLSVGGQFQIVIGPAVSKLYPEIASALGYEHSETISDPDAEKEDRELWFSKLFKGFWGSNKSVSGNVLCAPAPGELVPLSEVDDKAFSSGVLGKGVAVIPSVGEIYAPTGGTLTTIPASGHAVGITTDDGAEILIHVGMDTVTLKGEGFTPLVKVGSRVTKGQLLLRFDIEYIKSRGFSTVTPVVIANSDDFNVTVIKEKGTVSDKNTPVISYK